MSLILTFSIILLIISNPTLQSLFSISSKANADYPNVKLFIYMDSDAVVDKQFESTPVNEMLKSMQLKLNWDPELKPMVFNQVRNIYLTLIIFCFY